MRKILISALSVAFALSGVTNVRAETTPIRVSGSQKVSVVGEEWGAGVNKTILELDQVISGSSVSADDFDVLEVKDGTETSRTIVDAYVSDEKGNEIVGSWFSKAESKYVTVELGISPSEGNPLTWSMKTWRNTWPESYELKVSLVEGAELITSGSVVVNGIDVEPKVKVEDHTTQVYNQLEGVTIDSYTYTTEEGKEVVVPYGFYQPDEDGHKNGIIVWNHGIGEGGTDPKIAMYGNEVTALFGDEFQDVMDGCYVLVAQVPNDGSRDKDRATAIVELVKKLAASNSDIDLNRVYVAGCSAGGGMTSTIVNYYADFFAAALPICPAGTIQAENVGDLPLWYIHAENDSTVSYNGTKTNVEVLREAGKEVHTSIFPNVVGTYTDNDGNKAEYDGHWSWVYFFNNECYDEDGVNCWQWLSQQTNAVVTTPEDKPAKTGDDSAMVAYAILSLAAAGAYVAMRRKEEM